MLAAIVEEREKRREKSEREVRKAAYSPGERVNKDMNQILSV